MGFTLTERQLYGYKQIQAGKNVFITGGGGVGKSVLINTMEREFRNDAILIAPTGIAALNIGGATAHSVFHLPFGLCTIRDINDISKKVREKFEDNTIKRIIIDEISMVRADYFHAIDQKLRKIKRKDIPFGGLQIIAVGDFYQLPPVLKEGTKEAEHFYKGFRSPFCFYTEAWFYAKFETIQLDQVMRQSDEVFINNLNSIRTGTNVYEAVNFINYTCQGVEFNEEMPVLCTTNALADEINGDRFGRLPGEVNVYKSRIHGKFSEFPVDPNLRMKVGAKVIICANTPDGIRNGQTGFVTEMNPDHVLVEIDGMVQKIEPHTWEAIDYDVVKGHIEKTVIGEYTQIPLKLGYAITIHKSQGMSFDQCAIDLGWGSFAHGQTYVALSRVRDINKLHLFNDIKCSDVIIDKDVQAFYNILREAA